MPRKRNRSEKHSILYDGADPAKLLSRGKELPLHITQQLLGITPENVPEETAPPLPNSDKKP